MTDDKRINETAIYDFIINCEKFEKLNVIVNKFNPFNILGISHHEIRHSNVLAWLLCPNENHNLGDKIIRKIVLKILNNPENENSIPDDILIKDVQNYNFYDVKIYREWNNIDLVAISELNQFILIIENKIYSGEHSGQLDRYLKICHEHFSDKYKILPVFLTLEGAIPSNEKYCILDYSTIYEVVKFNSELYADSMSDEVKIFIKHYLSTLGGLLIMDDNIRKLCLEIYSEYKDVINIIHDVGNQIDIEDSINDFKKQYPDIIETYRNNKSFWFLIPEFLNIPKMDHDWSGGYPLSFWFSEYYGKIKLILEIGPFDDPNERVNFLNHLSDNGIYISSRAKEPERKFTRICTDTKNIKDWSNKDEITEAMIGLYNQKKMVENKEKLLKAIRSYKWKN